jgi:hypothetical protein
MKTEIIFNGVKIPVVGRARAMYSYEAKGEFQITIKVYIGSLSISYIIAWRSHPFDKH